MDDDVAGTSTGDPIDPSAQTVSSATAPQIPADTGTTTREPTSATETSTSTFDSEASSSGLVPTTGAPSAWDPIVADGDRMFFVGNSYTGNDGGLPVHIERAWPNAGLPLHVETSALYYWGQGLGSMHTPDVVAAIETGAYDTCVVTSGALGDMLEFVPLVEASCDHFVVYMTWARNPTLTSMDSYRDGTEAIVADMRVLETMTDARVVPSGLVYYDLIADPPRDDLREDWLYYPQDIHQNGAGIALNVYVFYAALVGESPLGIEYEFVQNWDGSVIVSGERVATRKAEDGSFLHDEIVFDEEFRTALQQRAWDVTEAWFAGTTEFD